MKIAHLTLKSEAPYSQSRHYDKVDVPQGPNEAHDAYEERTWRHRMHITEDGFVDIPAMAICNAVKESAKRMSISVPGRGTAKFGKYFDAGIMVPNNYTLPIKASDVPGERLFVPSDGRRGSGKRVYKTFPRINEWLAHFDAWVFDDIIPEIIFEKVLLGAGLLVGIGRWRPERGGIYGRFTVQDISWTIDNTISLSMAEETTGTDDGTEDDDTE